MLHPAQLPLAREAAGESRERRRTTTGGAKRDAGIILASSGVRVARSSVTSARGRCRGSGVGTRRARLKADGCSGRALALEQERALTNEERDFRSLAGTRSEARRNAGGWKAKRDPLASAGRRGERVPPMGDIPWQRRRVACASVAAAVGGDRGPGRPIAMILHPLGTATVLEHGAGLATHEPRAGRGRELGDEGDHGREDARNHRS